jgi:hypothetical protein
VKGPTSSMAGKAAEVGEGAHGVVDMAKKVTRSRHNRYSVGDARFESHPFERPGYPYEQIGSEI